MFLFLDEVLGTSGQTSKESRQALRTLTYIMNRSEESGTERRRALSQDRLKYDNNSTKPLQDDKENKQSSVHPDPDLDRLKVDLELKSSGNFGKLRVGRDRTEPVHENLGTKEGQKKEGENKKDSTWRIDAGIKSSVGRDFQDATCRLEASVTVIPPANQKVQKVETRDGKTREKLYPDLTSTPVSRSQRNLEPVVEMKSSLGDTLQKGIKKNIRNDEGLYGTSQDGPLSVHSSAKSSTGMGREQGKTVGAGKSFQDKESSWNAADSVGSQDGSLEKQEYPQAKEHEEGGSKDIAARQVQESSSSEELFVSAVETPRKTENGNSNAGSRYGHDGDGHEKDETGRDTTFRKELWTQSAESDDTTMTTVVEAEQTTPKLTPGIWISEEGDQEEVWDEEGKEGGQEQEGGNEEEEWDEGNNDTIEQDESSWRENPDNPKETWDEEGDWAEDANVQETGNVVHGEGAESNWDESEHEEMANGSGSNIASGGIDLRVATPEDPQDKSAHFQSSFKPRFPFAKSGQAIIAHPGEVLKQNKDEEEDWGLEPASAAAKSPESLPPQERCFDEFPTDSTKYGVRSFGRSLSTPATATGFASPSVSNQRSRFSAASQRRSFERTSSGSGKALSTLLLEGVLDHLTSNRPGRRFNQN